MFAWRFRREGRRDTGKHTVVRSRVQSRHRITHQHPTLPKTAEEPWSVMQAFERNGGEDVVAVCETVPVVVPARTRGEFGACITSEVIVVVDLRPPLPGGCGDKLGDLVCVELVDVLLRGTNVEAELEGVGARSREMVRDGDREDFAVGKVDEFRRYGREGDAELDIVGVVEVHSARKAVAVLRVVAVYGEEGVWGLRGVTGEGHGVVNVWSEVGCVLEKSEGRG